MLWSRLRGRFSHIGNLKLSKTLLRNMILPISLIIPVCVLYLLYPYSFQITFGGGRFPYLIFLWILLLEFGVHWRDLSSIGNQRLDKSRTIALILSLTLPTAYVLAFSYTGLSQSVVQLGRLLGVPLFNSAYLVLHWPVSLELVLFAACFSLSTLLKYRREGSHKLAVALFFLWAVAVFNMVDTFFPVGRIWALQIFVPFTANSSASVLRSMGYTVQTAGYYDPVYSYGVRLVAVKGHAIFSAIVFWPSAGIHSMIIYTLTILLFLTEAPLSIMRKAVVFVIGAIGTFTANILRIVTIIEIGLQNGTLAAQHFHDYYGEFFFISWMLIFLAAVFLGPRITQKLTKHGHARSSEPPGYRAHCDRCLPRTTASQFKALIAYVRGGGSSST